jgi:uncharacterized protein YjdB
MKKTRKRMLSLLLAAVIAITAGMPAMNAFAADDGVEGFYDIELFYKDTDTLVPTYIDENAAERERYIEYMVEGQKLNLTYKLIDTQMPDNGYIKWFSEEPTLVDVDQNGVVKAFDSSKGAVVQLWIDNEVKSIPVVGSLMGKALEKALFNQYINIETMDTEEICDLVTAAFGSDSYLSQWSDSYEGTLVDSLRTYLNNINSNVHVQLYDADGTLLDDDYVQIVVTKNEEWYANFLPNGTHITNKSQVNTTVAVGSTCQLYAITTPRRLNFGTVYSVKSSSIFEQGKVVATVNDSGLVSFKNTGTVTIMASPDSEDVIEGILNMVNYVYALENTGTIDSDKIAGILIDYVGLDMNRTVLAGLLDIAFVVKDVAGDTADPVQLSATAVEIIANLVLQFVYNDTITFTVVEAQPLTGFSISGANTVREGSQIAMSITDIQPDAGDISDIVWSSSDPTVASVDPVTGVITGRDAGGALGQLSSRDCWITATSTTNNISREVKITVTGKTGMQLSDVAIRGKDYLEIGEETNYSFTVYPSRVAENDNLYTSWGILTGYDENGEPVYQWADADNPATDGIGSITATGHYTIVTGGVCTIAVKAMTGYYIAGNTFFEVSSIIKTLEVTNGIPVENIVIRPTGATSNGSLDTVKDVTINGETHTYVTIKKGIMEAYYGNGAVISAEVFPANATNKNITWVVDNGYYDTEVSNNTHTIEVTQKVGHESADTFNVYAVNHTGKVVSNVITVCITKNYVTNNVIDNANISVVKGKKVDATHTISFNGSITTTGAACYKCNWYSSDEAVFTVASKGNDNRDAVVTGVDVGTATLYCVSADGGIVAEATVTVYPDKDYLREIVKLCDKTVIVRTAENRSAYSKYMNKLDLAYYILYDEPLASQSACDTYAKELLYAFYKLGGFVGIADVTVLKTGGAALNPKHVTVEVGSLANYKNSSYDFDFSIKPKNAMYSDVVWTSSNPNISVDKNGICTPTENDPCSAIITCTVTDYMGTEISSSAYVSFAKTVATGVELNTYTIRNGGIGDTQQLTATVLPNETVKKASCKSVLWSSSDESVATVDADGVVTFVDGGDCVITCTTYDGAFTAQCAVNVVTNYTRLELLVRQYNDMMMTEESYLPDSWADYSAAMAQAQTILANRNSMQPEVDAAYKNLKDKYEKLEKYVVMKNVELYLDGEQTREFYQYDLSLLREGISYKNAVLDLNIRLSPNNASYQSVEWVSSTDKISVTSAGKCSPTVNESCYGMITCTVTDHTGHSCSDSVWVSFSYTPVTSMDMSDSSISGEIGDTYQLSCVVMPKGYFAIGGTRIGAASIQDFYWESANPEVATVSSNGLVTFVSTGATVVRAISYDGGVTGECVVSTQGDRSALLAAIEQCSSIDYRDYEYSYGMAFKSAYEAAQNAMTEIYLSQAGIDSATQNLLTAAANLAGHEYIKPQDAVITYKTYKRPALASNTWVVSNPTTVNGSALSVNISNGYADNNNRNDVYLYAAVTPSNAMYNSVQWVVNSTEKMDYEIDGTTLKLTPKNKDDGGYANVTAKITDNYGRLTTRTLDVVVSDKTASGFDITQSEATYYVTAATAKLAYSLSGNPEFKGINWSSSDESVVRIGSDATMTFVEKGTATITGRTKDGGYTDTIRITLLTDFKSLAAKKADYTVFLNNTASDFRYTAESLAALRAAVNEADAMITDGTATQAEVNDMIQRLDAAKNGLVDYVAATNVNITAEEDSNITVVKDGYIRYKATAINGKSIQLIAEFDNPDAVYKSMEWTSSNSNVTINQDGYLTNNSAKPAVTRVKCRVVNEFDEVCVDYAYVCFTRYAVTGISFEDEVVAGGASTTRLLTPTITNAGSVPSSDYYVVMDCEYTSSNSAVATVDDSGLVTFVGQGSATITATTKDGGFSTTIQAYTTWDTTALAAAIAEADDIVYTDYAYQYGMAFKDAYEDAQEVYANIYATQLEIDDACIALTEAMSDLEGNEFIVPEVTVMNGENELNNSAIIEVDEMTAQAVLDVVINDGAMIKSSNIAVSDANAATVTVDGNEITATKTGDNSAFTLTVSVVDDYDREYEYVYTVSLIDEIVPATAVTILANGEPVSGPVVENVSGITGMRNFRMQLGCVITPADANAVTDIEYTTSAPTLFEISETGEISLTTTALVQRSNTATFTCTVTNLDGTTVSASFELTVAR